MNIYNALIALICLSAAFAFINQKYLKLPFVIGLFVLSTVLSVLVVSAKYWLHIPIEDIEIAVANAKIDKIILNVLLGFLLFAGSLHTDWSQVKKQLKAISVFAFGGVLLSTVIIAGLLYSLTSAVGLHLDFIYCLLFGALISPTDPIAVLGILKQAKVPKKIETTIVGESLFNDGVGVVVFIALLEILNSGGSDFSLSHFGLLFIQEAIGGVAIGLAMGYILHLLLRSIDHYETEVLITLAFVMGGYALSSYLHLSGALAMVIMGLMAGNYRPKESMSDTTHEYINKFWELIDVILNAILFILIAFVLIVIDFTFQHILVGIISIFIVLLSRIVVVQLARMLFSNALDLSFKEAKIIIWGGLRGGLSLALVLSLPEGESKEILLISTYFCVLFSIIIQGMTIAKVAKNNK
ncbi:sodium:proton antiporter [Lacihabitans sp. LS3-19]|uniref:cation:proton antiporter n=1 Tax=Lacihabitans sp. LS3-19 TaxID=2487335 RepID=UPI0020CCA0EA|nr:sodium:proton antiporter [Lacihabitans sp. LS3-19]MCP9768235.1 sodium:proton antiporter [Lacihabitans sp. LS3-19]